MIRLDRRKSGSSGRNGTGGQPASRGLNQENDECSTVCVVPPPSAPSSPSPSSSARSPLRLIRHAVLAHAAQRLGPRRHGVRRGDRRRHRLRGRRLRQRRARQSATRASRQHHGGAALDGHLLERAPVQGLDQRHRALDRVGRRRVPLHRRRLHDRSTSAAQPRGQAGPGRQPDRLRRQRQQARCATSSWSATPCTWSATSPRSRASPASGRPPSTWSTTACTGFNPNLSNKTYALADEPGRTGSMWAATSPPSEGRPAAS